MPRKPISFDLDFVFKDIFPRFTVKQFDDVTFNIKPKLQGSDYDTTGMTGKIFVGVNNDMFMQTEGITVTSNNINIILDKNMLQKNGRAYAEIELTDSNGTITSSSFIFNIDAKVGEGGQIPGGIEGFVQKYERLISEFKSQVNSSINSCNDNVANKLNSVDAFVNTKISDFENRFNTLTSSKQQDAEVIDARGGENSLKARLDKINSQLEQTMNNTNYVSVKSYGAIGDGVNDDTQAIQKCLNENNNVLFNDGIFLITDTLNLKSNHNILGANATIKSITDDVIGLCGKNVSNIIIDGLTFKCNDVGDGGLLNAVKIYYADNIIIRNLDVSTCKFGIFVHNITNFTIENILFNQIRTDSYSNKDGIHINGNSHYGYIKNIKGTTDDDMIALNADEVTWCFGDITNITIDGVYTINNQEYGVKDSTYQGIKLLALESKIDNINITNCYIKSDNQECFKIMGYGDVIGNFGRINITNSYFYRTSKDSQDIPVGLISNANIEELTIQNVNFEKHTPYGNFIKTTETCDINNFVVDNVRFNNLSDAPFILMYLYGNFDKVSITNINLKQNVNSALCVNRNGFINTLFFNNISLNNAQHMFRTTTGGGVYDLIMNNIKLITGNAIIETTNSTTISKISMNNIVFKDAKCLKISSEQTELVINQNNISGDDNITLSKNVNPIGRIRFKNGVVATFHPTFQGVGDEYTYILDGVATKKFYNGSYWVDLG